MGLLYTLDKLIKRRKPASRSDIHFTVAIAEKVCFSALAADPVTRTICAVLHFTSFKIASLAKITPLTKAVPRAESTILAESTLLSEAAPHAESATLAEAAILSEAALLSEAAPRAESAP
jgi:hypothetical protein